MTRFGVEGGDHVEVAITGGARDLIVQDVLVCVTPAYLIEMDIDTNEANGVLTHFGSTLESLIAAENVAP